MSEFEWLSSLMHIFVAVAFLFDVCRLFAGFLPRVLWISAGGFIFLGTYEQATHSLNQYL